jgi:TadE-like protein
MRIAMPRHTHAKGQAVVEFALASTLIFFLLAAAVDLGLIFFTLQGLHNAAQEGASYGSRWLVTSSGGMALDYAGIRSRARMEAGNRGAGFANLLDLNNNGQDDAAEDPGGLDAPSGTSVFPTYIQVNALKDVDADGNPLNDFGTDGRNVPCPDVANANIQNCYLQVVVSTEYRMLFPLAPGFTRQRRLSSSYVIEMRSGVTQTN